MGHTGCVRVPGNPAFLQNALRQRLSRNAAVSSGILTSSVGTSVGTRVGTWPAGLQEQTPHAGPLQQQTCVCHWVGGCTSEIRAPAWSGSADEVVPGSRRPSSPVLARDSELWRPS